MATTTNYPENDEIVHIPRPKFGREPHEEITLTMVETHAWSVAGVTLSYKINPNGWSRWIGTYEEYVSLLAKVLAKVTKKLDSFPSPSPGPTFISREVFAPLLWEFARYNEKTSLSGRELAKIHLLTEQALSGYLILCAKASPGRLTEEVMKENYWLPVVQLLEAGEGATLPTILPLPRPFTYELSYQRIVCKDLAIGDEEVFGVTVDLDVLTACLREAGSLWETHPEGWQVSVGDLTIRAKGQDVTWKRGRCQTTTPLNEYFRALMEMVTDRPKL